MEGRSTSAGVGGREVQCRKGALKRKEEAIGWSGVWRLGFFTFNFNLTFRSELFISTFFLKLLLY